MFNEEKLSLLVSAYKNYFPNHWENEKYKWQAIKHFQQYWDIDAANFSKMFARATDRTANLLTTKMFFPKGMIIDFSNANTELTRGMFVNLFNEDNSLKTRITNFINQAEQIRQKYGKSKWKKHYQTINAISIYLWLRYPDKYYIYKYADAYKFSKIIDSSFIPKQNGQADTIIEIYNLYTAISKILLQDEIIVKMLQEALTPDCYEDKKLHTLINDIVYFTYKYYNTNNMSEKIYNSNLSIDLPNDKASVPHPARWWLAANQKIWSFTSLATNEEKSYTLHNENGNKRRIFQNFLAVKPGDTVICYETTPLKQIVALAEITQGHDEKKGYHLFQKNRRTGKSHQLWRIAKLP